MIYHILNHNIFFILLLALKEKKRKQIRLDNETNQLLSDFCLQNNYSNSSVAAQAILAFINDKGDDFI